MIAMTKDDLKKWNEAWRKLAGEGWPASEEATRARLRYNEAYQKTAWHRERWDLRAGAVPPPAVTCEASVLWWEHCAELSDIAGRPDEAAYYRDLAASLREAGVGWNSGEGDEIQRQVNARRSGVAVVIARRRAGCIGG